MKSMTITFTITMRRILLTLIMFVFVVGSVAILLPPLVRPREDFSWIKTIPVNPSEFIFDLEIVALNQTDFNAIAPMRAWRDKTFTYIDFGDKVPVMALRPVVTMLVWGSGESPVGFRTDGGDGRLIIVEAVGDFVLSSGPHKVYIVAPDEISTARWELIRGEPTKINPQCNWYK